MHLGKEKDATIRDRRLWEKGRDEDFIVSSWAWVWSSWPGDLLCSVLLPLPSQSLTCLPNGLFVCCFLSAYGSARAQLNGDLILLLCDIVS